MDGAMFLQNAQLSDKQCQNPGGGYPVVSNLAVIIPVFNEEKTLSAVLDAVLHIDIVGQIIVVDDASTDTTPEILESWKNRDNVIVVRHDANRGKGAAIRTALECVREKYIIIQDADLEYDPTDYTSLLQPLLDDRADVVFGSRHLGRKHFENIRDRSPLNPFRIAVSALNGFVRLLYHLRITDEATCYKIFPSDTLRKMDLACERFEFCPEVTAKLCRMKLRLIEVPIHYAPRSVREGKKIRFHDALEAFYTLWKYRNWQPKED